ncbi:MAG TPA: polymer-forming cytoskeletal protein [Candidatus Methylacidiphilales bacterium]|jgi:cytoskeletal protein CcmA (bactofilin family)|nr:polymer-forming cytoskeletal protein [Candidatus Methylacidiphilales bacterium]
MSTFTDTSKRPSLPVDPARPGQPAGTRTTTVLTSDCEFKGALAFSGELELHGRLEGTIESEGGALTVGEQALIKAEIKVNDVLIYGKVQGNIHATGRIEIRGKAEVYGDLHSNRLAMDDGVVFVGRSTALSGKSQPSGDFSKMFTRLGTVAKTNSTPANSTTGKPSE